MENSHFDNIGSTFLVPDLQNDVQTITITFTLTRIHLTYHIRNENTIQALTHHQ